MLRPSMRYVGLLNKRHINFDTVSSPIFDCFRISIWNNSSILPCRTLIIPANKKRFVEIKFPKNSSPQQIEEVLEVHQTWLRHHCRCPACYNFATNQRKIKLDTILLNSTITKSSFQEDHVLFKWNDNHESKYSFEWLQQNVPKFDVDLINNRDFKFSSSQIVSSASKKTTQELLDSSLDFESFMIKPKILKKFLECLVSDGIAIIVNAPATAEGTLRAVQRISHQQRTLYGDGPTITTSDLEHKDTAYTNEFLDLHTDTSYFSEPMGLQILHLLHHKGTGGSNSFSDGFHAARLLYEESQELYFALARTPILSEYVDPGKHHYANTDFILSHNFITGDLERVRFNALDMGTLKMVNPHALSLLYDGLVRFSKILENEAHQIWPKPGTIVFIDNWRTLHGRTKFTGRRSMASAYIARSDWLSKARVMGVI